MEKISYERRVYESVDDESLHDMMIMIVGELTVCIVFPTIAIRMYRSSPLVPLDSCLTAAACLSSAC